MTAQSLMMPGRRALMKWWSGNLLPQPALSLGIVMHDFSLGGTERIALRLARSWCDLGAKVTILCGSTDGALRQLVDARVRIVTPQTAIARGRGSRRRLAAFAARHFSANRVDGVFVPGNFHWPVVPALARLPQAVRPMIVAQVSAALDKPQRGMLRQLAFNVRMRFLLAGADRIVALSDHARDQANSITHSDRAITIPLPALEDDIAPPLAVPANRTIVASGRLVPEKGFFELIDAFATLDMADAELIIVGEGPSGPALKARAVEHGIADRTSFPGYVPDTRPWLDRARIVVMPSHFEGYPAALVEALAAGRPVVATACTPATSLLLADPAFGRLVPIRDVAALSEAMALLLAESPPNPAALARSVHAHSIGPVAQAYLDLFAHAAVAG